VILSCSLWYGYGDVEPCRRCPSCLWMFAVTDYRIEPPETEPF
jgi:hypothetical protein